MSKSEIITIIIKALLSWLMTDADGDGVPDRLEPFLRDSEASAAKSDKQ